MQFSSALISLAATLASANALQLVTKSDDSEVNNKGVSFTHEGAGINYVFLGEGSADLTYDESEKSLTSLLAGRFPIGLAFQDKILEVSVLSSSDKWTFNNDGYLEQNGEVKTYYACKNFNDPYDYSSMSYGVLNEKVNDSCKEIKIAKSGNSSSSSSSAAASPSTTTASASATKTPAPSSKTSASATTTVAPTTTSEVDWANVDWANVDWSAINWSSAVSAVDWSAIDWSSAVSGVEWSTVDWATVDWATVSYPSATATA